MRLQQSGLAKSSGYILPGICVQVYWQQKLLLRIRPQQGNNVCEKTKTYFHTQKNVTSEEAHFGQRFYAIKHTHGPLFISFDRSTPMKS